LGVPAALLAEHGAVSEPVALALADGALRRLGADLSIAVTGIAGPGGGTAEKPVGLVFIATAVQGKLEARRFVFPGSRGEIRARATQAALFLLHLRLRSLAALGSVGPAA
jgi:nicotinamide-nucleotide amidase